MPGGSIAAAEQVMREALAQASEILQSAARQLGARIEPGIQRVFEDLRTAAYDLRVSRPREAIRYMEMLQKLPGVRGVAITAVDDKAAHFSVMTESFQTLLRGLLAMRGPYRPRGINVRGSTIDVDLGPGPETDGGAPVFQLGADVFFGARHFVVIDGKRGPPHFHSWRSEVVIESRHQTDEGVVVGFAEARRLLGQLVAPYNQALLNSVPPFDQLQPTAENVARHLYTEFKRQFEVESAVLRLMRVWESPTSYATFAEEA
jgi:6-pyruvoyltetrahydropterin/6-carboxytetrahydropterin synthase